MSVVNAVAVTIGYAVLLTVAVVVLVLLPAIALALLQRGIQQIEQRWSRTYLPEWEGNAWTDDIRNKRTLRACAELKDRGYWRVTVSLWLVQLWRVCRGAFRRYSSGVDRVIARVTP